MPRYIERQGVLLPRSAGRVARNSIYSWHPELARQILLPRFGTALGQQPLSTASLCRSWSCPCCGWPVPKVPATSRKESASTVSANCRPAIIDLHGSRPTSVTPSAFLDVQTSRHPYNVLHPTHSPVSRCQYHAADLKCSKRSASRSRPGRSLSRLGRWIAPPCNRFKVSSIGPSFWISSHSDTCSR